MLEVDQKLGWRWSQNVCVWLQNMQWRKITWSLGNIPGRTRSYVNDSCRISQLLYLFLLNMCNYCILIRFFRYVITLISGFSVLRHNTCKWICYCYRVDNNLKVVLMLEVFLHEDENLFKVWCCSIPTCLPAFHSSKEFDMFLMCVSSSVSAVFHFSYVLFWVIRSLYLFQNVRIYLISSLTLPSGSMCALVIRLRSSSSLGTGNQDLECPCVVLHAVTPCWVRKRPESSSFDHLRDWVYPLCMMDVYSIWNPKFLLRHPAYSFGQVLASRS